MAKQEDKWKIERGEIHDRFWKRTVKEAFKNDPLRIIIELIKNSADSYTRLERKKLIKPPFEILVRLSCWPRKPPYVEAIDNAEGMNSKKLKNALTYGAPTSLEEDEEATTSAEKGIGLKDAMMAMDENLLITIRDNKLNERKKYPNFDTGIGRVDENVANEERKKLHILNNGTIVKGKLPEYFHEKKFETIYEHLQQHFMLRKLLQLPEYKIYLVDTWSDKKKLLNYTSPEIKEEIIKGKEGEIKINHDDKEYKMNLIINKAKKELSQGKPFGESGILFYYGRYTVLDFTLGVFDRDLSMSKFFGEVKMNVEHLVREGEILVDEKRRGLDMTHPLNIALVDEINKKLRRISEKEKEETEYSLDRDVEREVLNELNKIDNIRGVGPPPPPPIEPETFAFYPVHNYIKEYEEKTIFLVINSSIIQDDLEIVLKYSNEKIKPKPEKIKISKEEIEEKFIKKQIKVYSENVGENGKIIAKSEGYESAEAGIEVIENSIFSPEGGFAFVPNKTTIIKEGKKEIALIINEKIINNTIKEIVLNSEDPIECPGKWSLPDVKNLGKYKKKDVIIIPIEIKAKKIGKAGDKARIYASYCDKSAELVATIVPDPLLGGLFKGFELSATETKEICKFIKETGIVEIYYKHPLMKKYMGGNFRNSNKFLVFIADILTRETTRAFIENNPSSFPIYNIDNPEEDRRIYFTEQYYSKGSTKHEIFWKLARTLQLKK